MALKVRTYKLFIMFDEEDWSNLSDLLKQRFPSAVYFSRDTKRPLLDANREERKDWQITYWDSLSSFQHERSNNVCIFRDPWPADIASGKPLDLIGGWEDSYMDQSEAGFHRHGRCVEIMRYRRNLGQQDIANSIDSFGRPAIEQIGTLPASSYNKKKFFLHERFSTLKVSFNEADVAVTTFAKDIRRIVQGLGTRSVALYDPLTDSIIQSSFDTSRALVGWQLLKKIHDRKIGYLMMPPVFDDITDWHPKREGVAALIGPRPSHPRVKKWDAKTRL